MKKILVIVIIVVILIIGIIGFVLINNNNNVENNENANQENNNGNDDSVKEEEGDILQIRVSDGANTIIYELNDSDAARDLYEQLPISIEVEDYSTNEKIFYPENELNVNDTPLASGGLGVLAYYEPWGDVVMFYDDFRENNSLYELGHAISGENSIRNLSGNIAIEKND